MKIYMYICICMYVCIYILINFVWQAAQFMDIRDLLDLTCAKVASVCMKGKTPEEIRKVFNLPKDETPEEKAKLDEMYPFTVKK